MIKVYTLQGSTNGRNAIAWMKDNGINHVRRQVTLNNPLTKAELIEILRLTEDGYDDIIAKGSKAYKELEAEGIDLDELTLSEFAYILTKMPTLMRSPIIITPKFAITKYNEDIMTKLIPRSKRTAWYEKALAEIRAEEDLRYDEADNKNGMPNKAQKFTGKSKLFQEA